MKQTTIPLAEQYQKEHKQQRQWRRLGRMLAAVAAFYTVYAMVLPAVTWEGELQCTLPEHVHTATCYLAADTEQEAHIYGEEAPADKALICVSPENAEERQPSCGMQEHTHTAACFAQIKAEENPYVCNKESHTHTQACYFPDGALRCTQEEHSHTEACLQKETEPVRMTATRLSASADSSETSVYYQRVEEIVPDNKVKYLILAAAEDYALGSDAKDKGKGTPVTMQAVPGVDGYYTIEKMPDGILWYMREDGSIRNVDNRTIYLMPGNGLFGSSAVGPSYTWNEDGTCVFSNVVNKVTGYLYEAGGVFSYGSKGTADSRKMRIYKEVTELPSDEPTQTLCVQAAFPEGEPQTVQVQIYAVSQGNLAEPTAFTDTLSEENGYTALFAQLPALPEGGCYAVRAQAEGMTVLYGEERTVLVQDTAISVGTAAEGVVTVQCIPAVLLPQTGGAGDGVFYAASVLLWSAVLIGGYYRCRNHRKI